MIGASKCKYAPHWSMDDKNRTRVGFWYSSMYQTHLKLFRNIRFVLSDSSDITTQCQVHLIQAAISDTHLFLSIYCTISLWFSKMNYHFMFFILNEKKSYFDVKLLLCNTIYGPMRMYFPSSTDTVIVPTCLYNNLPF